MRLSIVEPAFNVDADAKQVADQNVGQISGLSGYRFSDRFRDGKHAPPSRRGQKATTLSLVADVPS